MGTEAETERLGPSHSLVFSGSGGVGGGRGPQTRRQHQHKPGWTPQTAPFLFQEPCSSPYKKDRYSLEVGKASVQRSTKEELEIL